jgi:hypothetical protein
MSPRYSQSGGDGRPAEDDRRSFTTGIGSMVDPADDATAPPTRPTFTAKPSEPEAGEVPEPVPGLDDATEPDFDPIEDEPEGSATTASDLEPVDAVPAEPGAPPEAGPVPSAEPVASAGPVPYDGLVADGGLVPEAGLLPGDRPVPDDRLVPDAYPVTDDGPVPGFDLASPDGDRTRAGSRAAVADLDDPLLSDADGLRTRWQRVQAGFVDDPREAVGDAADLIEQTAQAMVGALRQRQRQLRVMWERGPANGAAAADVEPAAYGADTEHLRQMMQHYRALFNQLCRP